MEPRGHTAGSVTFQSTAACTCSATGCCDGGFLDSHSYPVRLALNILRNRGSSRTIRVREQTPRTTRARPPSSSRSAPQCSKRIELLCWCSTTSRLSQCTSVRKGSRAFKKKIPKAVPKASGQFERKNVCVQCL